MSRIDAVFSAKNKDALLVPFMTAGFPFLSSTLNMMHQAAEAGGDIIELGVPFSDPMADGPTIQRASEQALKNGATLEWVLQTVADFRQTNQTTPVVLMGYANSFYRMGMEAFLATAAEAGVDGVIIVDLSDMDRKKWQEKFRQKSMDIISLIAPTTPADRIKDIAAAAQGFLYYISLRGVTGAASLDVAEIKKTVAIIREQTALPLAVGFGVREPAHVAELAPLVEAVVIGSKLMELAESDKDNAATLVGQFLQDANQQLQGQP